MDNHESITLLGGSFFPFFFFLGGVNVSVQFEYVVQEPCIERSCIEKSWVQKGGDFWWIFFSFICPSLI